jgi:hypothetical protein
MTNEFTHAVFLSHSANDKAVVRASSLSASNGERAGVRCRSLLRQDGLKVWFDETENRNPNPEIRNKSELPNERNPKPAAQHPTDMLPVYPIGEFELVSDFGFRDSDLQFGLPGMSANALGADWAQLEAGTCGRRNLRFRTPLNQERRFTSEFQPSAFILQPFPDASIKGSLAQLLSTKKNGL